MKAHFFCSFCGDDARRLCEFCDTMEYDDNEDLLASAEAGEEQVEKCDPVTTVVAADKEKMEDIQMRLSLDSKMTKFCYEDKGKNCEEASRAKASNSGHCRRWTRDLEKGRMVRLD